MLTKICDICGRPMGDAKMDFEPPLIYFKKETDICSARNLSSDGLIQERMAERNLALILQRVFVVELIKSGLIQALMMSLWIKSERLNPERLLFHQETRRNLFTTMM